MVDIQYNGQNPFDGISETPLLSRSENFVRTNSKIYREDNITLSGRIKRTLDNGNSFENIYGLVTELIKRWSTNFGTLEIIENSVTIFSYNYTIVESIVFDEDKYYDLVPYTITLKCLKDNFIDTYGITNPSETYEFVEEEGCLVSITHKISCNGVKNNRNAIENARRFIDSRRGFNLSFSPVGYSVTTPILISQLENAGNYTGEMSLTEVYSYDKSNLSGDRSVIEEASVELDVSDGIAIITVSGSYQGSFGASMDYIRSLISISNLYGLANQDYLLYNSSGGLKSSPISFNIQEDPDRKRIDFSVVFSDKSSQDPYIVDSTKITISGVVSCIECKIQIISDIGCPAERLRKTTEYYNTLDIYTYVTEKWATFGDGTFIGRVAKSSSLETDALTGIISITVVYCNNNYESCNCLNNLSYRISVSEAIPQFSESASLGGEGCYYIQDLNFKTRSKFSVDGRATPSKCCNNNAIKSAVFSRVNQLMAEYFNATDIILETCNIDISNDRTVVGFNVSWNGESNTDISQDIVYGNITKSPYSVIKNNGTNNIAL